MTDADVAGLKIAVQQALAHGDELMSLPVSLAARLASDIEGRTASHRRLLDAAATVIAAVGKWRAGDIDAGTAMQAISAAADAWDGGKS
jgi:hypothetical protein